jgi:hypothetical protein
MPAQAGAARVAGGTFVWGWVVAGGDCVRQAFIFSNGRESFLAGIFSDSENPFDIHYFCRIS